MRTTTQMTPEERDARLRLDASMDRLQSEFRRSPSVADIDLMLVDPAEAAGALEKVTNAVLEACSATEALANLALLTEDAAMIVATSQNALGLIQAVLSVAWAELDHRRIAA